MIAPELDAYTRGVAERLIGRPAPELRIYVMRDASFNASMFPSGTLIVNTGVLARIRNEAQFAAVLGHEAGHYFRKHALDRYRDTRRKSRWPRSRLRRPAQLLRLVPRHGVVEAHQPRDLEARSEFSRDLESEADAFGLMLMARAGYPPRAASAICEQLIDDAGPAPPRATSATGTG